MEVSLGRIVIYAKNLEKMAEFYKTYFGFKVLNVPDDRIVELKNPKGGASIMLHPVTKSVKMGQVTVKLVFDVKDVEKFKNNCANKGLKFGTVHKVDRYLFSNAKDPDKNSIQISSRKFAYK